MHPALKNIRSSRRLCGIESLDDYLECNQVAAVPSGEQNLHIFYYVMASTFPEERQHLHLADETQHHYLGQLASGGAHTDNFRGDDANWFEQLKLSLSSPLCCPSDVLPKHASSLQPFSAFKLATSSTWSTVIMMSTQRSFGTWIDVDVLGIVIGFLGVQPPALEIALAYYYKTELIKKELCTVFFNPDGASDNYDDLVKTLYSPFRLAK